MNKTTCNISVGKRVRDAREFLKISRETFAERTSMSVRNLIAIETGERGFTIDSLRKISECLTVSTDYILFGRDFESSDQTSTILHMLDNLSDEQRTHAIEILKQYVLGCKPR